MSYLPDTVRELRESAGLSLGETMRRSGVSKAHIHSIEKGQSTNITLDTIFRLSHVFGVAPSKILNAAYQDWQSHKHDIVETVLKKVIRRA